MQQDAEMQYYGSKFLLISVKKNLKFFYFLGTVTDVVTFGLHNFESFLGLR
jgi:hypothetical protein